MSWTLALEAVEEHKAIQKPQELADLIDRLDGCLLDNVLEIGSQDGGTFWLWKQLADVDSLILGIDKDLSRFDPDLITARHLAWERDSHTPGTAEDVRRYFHDQTLDLLFLDGDHSRLGVETDYEMYEPLVRDGGLVVFHDIADHIDPNLSEVHLFWRELEGDKWVSIWSHATNLWNGNVLPAASCGIGVLRVVR